MEVKNILDIYKLKVMEKQISGPAQPQLADAEKRIESMTK